MKTEKISINTPKFKKDYTLVFTDKIEEFDELIDKLCKRPADYVFGVDIETGALPEHKNNKLAALSPLTSQPRLIQIATESTTVVFDLTGPNAPLQLEGLKKFKTFLEERVWCAHYAVFELAFFIRHVITKRPDAHCSMLLAKLLLHSSRPTDTQGLSLDALSTSEFGIELAKGNQTSDWTKPLTWEQVIYAGMDAIVCRELYYHMIGRVNEKKLDKIYTLVRRAQWPIVKMQLQGIALDDVAYKKHIQHWSAELVKARNVLVEQYGLKKITGPTMADWLERNLDEKTLSIWPRTEKTEKLKTDAHAFSEFGHLNIVKPISTYQKYDKLLSTYGQTMLDLRSSVTGKLHTRFNLLGARTGRLSSSEPNFQNFPRDKDVRSAFIPDSSDQCFVVADYSQIEVRVAAEYSRDKNLLRIYKNGLDVYKYTAAAVSGKKYEAVTKEERQLGKALLLGMLYGLGAKKFAHYAKKGYNVEMSADAAFDYVRAFRAAYPGYYDWQQAQAEMAQQAPYVVTTRLGKKRKLDKDNTYGTSMNHPIQGTSAEIMMLALCFVQKEIDAGAKCILVSNVHDEIILQCDCQFALDNAKLLSDNMTKAFSYVFPDGITRSLVEVGIGKSWAEAKSDENKVELENVGKH